MKKNKQYKIIASGRKEEIGLVVKIKNELEHCPGYWAGQFVTDNGGTGHPGDTRIKAGWWTTFTPEELEEV